MRCLSCNKALSDYEATMKDSAGRYLDFCRRCHAYIQDVVPAVGNLKLLHEGDGGLDDEEGTGYNSYCEEEK